MTDHLLVSVLMTAYNREAYIAEAIESVLASTYTNFELIVVDDCSTDNTVDIIRAYASQDYRIKLHINDKNVGDYPNRNIAARLAKGKYIKYVDSDDSIYPHGLEAMVESMEQFPQAGLGLCAPHRQGDKIYPFVLNPKEAYEYHFFGPGLFHKGPLAAIFLKTAFDTMGGFKEERMIGDTDMWHRMSLQYPVVVMQEGLVWQRVHERQESVDVHKYVITGAAVKWRYLLSPNSPLNKEQVRLINQQRIKRYSGFILSGLLRFNIRQVCTYVICLLQEIKIKVKTKSFPSYN